MAGTLDTRTFSALGFAEEICARPVLLAMFAEQLPVQSEATLVLTARDAAAAEPRLLEAAASVGLDDESLPDLLLLPLEELDEQTALRLANEVDAVVSELPLTGPLANVTRYGVGAGDLLRAHAERRLQATRLDELMPGSASARTRVVTDRFMDAPVVAELVSKLIGDMQATHIVAIGSEGVRRSLSHAGEAHLIGFAAAAELDLARRDHPAHTWIDWQAGSDPFPRLPSAVLERSIVLAGDVLSPATRGASLSALAEIAARALVTVLTDGSGRERLPELETALQAAGLPASFAGRTPTGDGSRDGLVAIVERACDRIVQRAPSDFRVTAVMSAYNEQDIIEQSILKLVDDGLDVHLVDNWSTDETMTRALALGLGDRLTVERFPAEGPTGTFDLTRLLENLERVVATIQDGWIVYLDVDEARRPPWPGVSLRDALHHVQRRGYNAVNHIVMRFDPVDDSFHDGDDFERRLRHFQIEPAWNTQVKAWDARVGAVDLARSGGHSAQFPGRRVFPWRFALQHYPLRSQPHAERKVFRDRAARWNPEEKARGWHRHYDRYGTGASFLRDPAELLRFDDEFVRDYVLERVAAVGLGSGLPAKS